MIKLAAILLMLPALAWGQLTIPGMVGGQSVAGKYSAAWQLTQELQASLVVWWRADGNALDSSTNANHGTLEADANANGIGVFNASFVFDGDGDYVEADDDDSLDFGTDDFSLNMWIKGTDDSATYISKRDLTNNNEGFTLYISGGKARVLTQPEGGSIAYVTGTKTINDNQWHMLTVVRDSGVLQIYTDAGDKQTVATSHNIDSSAPLQLSFQYGGSSANYFNGFIDEVMIFNSALSLSNVQYIYNRSRP